MDILDISGLYSKKEDNYYEAYERDIAVVHFFFQVTWYLQVNTQGSMIDIVPGADHIPVPALAADDGYRLHLTDWR